MRALLTSFFPPQQILDLTFNLYLVLVQSFIPSFSIKEIGIVEIQNTTSTVQQSRKDFKR